MSRCNTERNAVGTRRPLQNARISFCEIEARARVKIASITPFYVPFIFEFTRNGASRLLIELRVISPENRDDDESKAGEFHRMGNGFRVNGRGRKWLDNEFSGRIFGRASFSDTEGEITVCRCIRAHTIASWQR